MQHMWERETGTGEGTSVSWYQFSGFHGPEDGILRRPVNKNQYVGVPFGETEKAHEDIFSIFAQIMDDGELADSESTLANFTLSLVTLTSNIAPFPVAKWCTRAMAQSSSTTSPSSLSSQVLNTQQVSKVVELSCRYYFSHFTDSESILHKF